MKHFTPELLRDYGSDDPAVWREAEQRWEDALAAHAAHLDAVRDRMPPGVRQLADGYRLHDAQVRSMGSRAGGFVVVLQLDSPERPLLALSYDLADEPGIDREALPEESRSPAEPPEWQYDELEMEPGDPATWRQSVLLSNGWEVTLRFRDVRVEELRPLIPVTAAVEGMPAVAGALP